MQRRKFIASIGSVAAGAAAVTGTGAFTSVRADRSLSVETAGDANAFLTITKAEIDGDVTPNAKEYVEVDDEGEGKVSLDFTQVDETNAASASGANRNAETIFDNLLDVTNNGTQEVEVYVESDIIDGPFGIFAENTQDGDGDNNGFSESNSQILGPGESASNIGFSIPKNSSTGDVSGGTITFVAERTGGNRD